MKKVLLVIGILLVIAVILAVPRLLQRQNPVPQQAEAIVLKPVEVTKSKRGEIRLETPTVRDNSSSIASQCVSEGCRPVDHLKRR